MKLFGSHSDQNVYCTYVCLVSDIRPCGNTKESAMNRASTIPFHCAANTDTDELDADVSSHVGRSRAIHELKQSNRNVTKSDTQILSHEKLAPVEDKKLLDSNENADTINPNILKFTKMKWLTEHKEDVSDTSSTSPSVSPENSTSSLCSRESDENISKHISSGEKCLSTILRLDREHNMFGMSNIAIVGRRVSKKIRKENEKPAFPQTAIIQICCAKRCCKHKSNTDLPASLKCGGCQSCYNQFCSTCAAAKLPCEEACYAPCPSYPKIRYNCKYEPPAVPARCTFDCNTFYGMKISLRKKAVFEPSPIEITPRSSCVLVKPQVARPCNHVPRCCPASSCFPYLTPCYWPARPGAPCSHPSRCFHNPPCRPPRIRRAPVPASELCPKGDKCGAKKSKKSSCPNPNCPGETRSCNTETQMNKETLANESKVCKLCSVKRNKSECVCECHLPVCSSCFVRWPTRKKETL